METKDQKQQRPWWMVNGVTEPLGDVGQDRLFLERIVLRGEERRPPEEPTSKRTRS